MRGVIVFGLLLTSSVMGQERGFVVSGQEDIYYEAYGSGDVVVLSHGLGGNHAIWYQQVPALTAAYRVVTWDQRGFGRSSNRTQTAGPEAAVEDLRVLLDSLGVEQVHLVGQSMGGWAVMGFALRYPERVRSLILADTNGGLYTPELEAHFDAFLEELAAGPPIDELPPGHHPALGRQLVREDPAQAFLYEQIGSVAAPAPPGMMARLRATIYDHDRLAALTMPVLFVLGANDPIFPQKPMQGVVALVPNARLDIISNTGHSPYFEAPEEWNRLVLEFLRARE